LERLKAEPQLYDRVLVTAFRADNHPIAPAGSADVVISFRNLHNWMEREEVVESLRAFHKALKPGGVLGIVDHRGRTDQSQAQQMASGYVREDVAIALIEANGFRLTGRSEVNANPKDTKDHAEGVWSLPPTYRMKDVDRAKFQAIGESDRFTLRFVKR
jgi:predicted methyltransferase